MIATYTANPIPVFKNVYMLSIELVNSSSKRLCSGEERFWADLFWNYLVDLSVIAVIHRPVNVYIEVLTVGDPLNTLLS